MERERVQVFLVICAFLVVFLIAAGSESKKNSAKFRMEKINFIWEKAQHSPALSAAANNGDVRKRLDKLERDLGTFDELYFGLKHGEVGRNDVKKAAEKSDVGQIDAKLERLLERYDLESVVHAFRMKFKYRRAMVYSTTEEATENVNNAKINLDSVSGQRSSSLNFAGNGTENPFDDPRLAKIWREASSDEDTFSLHDLDELFFELSEQQRKLGDYDALIREHQAYTDRLNHLPTGSMNEDDEGLEEDGDAFLLKKMDESKRLIKGLGANLEHGISELQERFELLRQNPFQQKRVRKLWEKALKNRDRLIPNELDMIRAELRYMERHIDKTHFHAEHLDEHLREMADNDEGEAGEMAQKMRDHQAKLERKLRKLEHHLDELIAAKSAAAAREHIEL